MRASVGKGPAVRVVGTGVQRGACMWRRILVAVYGDSSTFKLGCHFNLFCIIIMQSKHYSHFADETTEVKRCVSDFTNLDNLTKLV